jgi:hypothetical protein
MTLCNVCAKSNATLRVKAQGRTFKTCAACVVLFDASRASAAAPLSEKVLARLCASCRLCKATKRVGTADTVTGTRSQLLLCDYCTEQQKLKAPAAAPAPAPPAQQCSHCRSRVASTVVTSATGQRFPVCSLCLPAFKKKLLEAAVLGDATGRTTMYMPPTTSSSSTRDERRKTTTGAALTKAHASAPAVTRSVAASADASAASRPSLASSGLAPKQRDARRQTMIATSTSAPAKPTCDECKKADATTKVEFDGHRRVVCNKCAERFRALSKALSVDRSPERKPARAVSQYHLAPGAPVTHAPLSSRPRALLPGESAKPSPHYGLAPPEADTPARVVSSLYDLAPANPVVVEDDDDDANNMYIPLAAPGVTVLATTELSDSSDDDGDLVIPIGVGGNSNNKIRLATMDSIAAILPLDDD